MLRVTSGSFSGQRSGASRLASNGAAAVSLQVVLALKSLSASTQKFQEREEGLSRSCLVTFESGDKVSGI